jgi:hypothetical protein
MSTKSFKLRDLVDTNKSTVFTDVRPPAWMLNSTHLWWYEDHVLTLEIGEYINTQFVNITRIL